MRPVEIQVERARIVVRLAVSAAPSDHEEHVEGLLDTGTTQSFISHDLIERLELEAIDYGEVRVKSLGADAERAETFNVHVRVPNPQFATASAPDHFSRELIVVAATGPIEGRHPSKPCGLLIGMDLITCWHVEIKDGVCTIRW